MHPSWHTPVPGGTAQQLGRHQLHCLLAPLLLQVLYKRQLALTMGARLWLEGPGSLLGQAHPRMAAVTAARRQQLRQQQVERNKVLLGTCYLHLGHLRQHPAVQEANRRSVQWLESTAAWPCSACHLGVAPACEATGPAVVEAVP